MLPDIFLQNSDIDRTLGQGLENQSDVHTAIEYVNLTLQQMALHISHSEATKIQNFEGKKRLGFLWEL